MSLIDSVAREAGFDTLTVIRQLARRVAVLETQLATLTRNNQTTNLLVQQIAQTGLEVYFGSSPSQDISVPQLWWDTSSNPWEVRANLVGEGGAPDWITIGRGLML